MFIFETAQRFLEGYKSDFLTLAQHSQVSLFMEKGIEKIIDQLFSKQPVLAIVIVLLVIVGYITWNLSAKYSGLKKRVKDVEDDCKNFSPKIDFADKELPNLNQNVSSLDKKVSSVASDVKDLSGAVNQINVSLNGLLVFLKMKHDDLGNALMRPGSPLQLTKLGLKILEETGGKKFIDEHLDLLLAEIEKGQITSNLDVQNYALLALQRFVNHQAYKPIKDYIYNNPQVSGENEIKLDINMDIVNSVLAIYLRNQFLNKNPDHDIEPPAVSAPKTA